MDSVLSVLPSPTAPYFVISKSPAYSWPARHKAANDRIVFFILLFWSSQAHHNHSVWFYLGRKFIIKNTQVFLFPEISYNILTLDTKITPFYRKSSRDTIRHIK